MDWRGNKQRRIAGVLVAAVLVITLASQPAFAATPNQGLNLTTSPLPISLVAKPGQAVSTDLRIQNSGNQSEQLKISLMKFTAYGDQGKPRLEDRAPGDNYFDWVSFSQNQFTADPGVWKTIHMTINVPPTAAFGYYYAVVFSRANAPTATAGTSALQGGVAVLVLLEAQVPGAKKQVNIVSFTADHKVYEFLPTAFSVKLHNVGNVHVAPAGDIFIKRGSKQVDILRFNPEQGNILPGTNRIFTVDWSNGFPVRTIDQNGKQTNKLKWDFNSPLSKFRFGHYTADLTAVYDNGERDVPIEASVSFWVIPWRILLGLLVLLVLLGLLAYKYITMRRKLKHLTGKGSKHEKA